MHELSLFGLLCKRIDFLFIELYFTVSLEQILFLAKRKEQIGAKGKKISLSVSR